MNCDPNLEPFSLSFAFFQVMEFYFNLITERSTKNPAKYPSVYTFGTFFYTRLEKGQALGRWARKLDFFSYDLLIVPIIHASHWRLVVSGRLLAQQQQSPTTFTNLQLFRPLLRW